MPAVGFAPTRKHLPQIQEKLPMLAWQVPPRIQSVLIECLGLPVLPVCWEYCLFIETFPFCAEKFPI